MHATYEVTQDGTLRYRTEWTLGGTDDEARTRALQVASFIRQHAPHSEVIVERVTTITTTLLSTTRSN